MADREIQEIRWFERARAIAVWRDAPYIELVQRIVDVQRLAFEDGMTDAKRPTRETDIVVNEIKAQRVPVRLSLLPYRPIFWSRLISSAATAKFIVAPSTWLGAFCAAIICACFLFDLYWSARGRRARRATD